jgi:hypothetical protein
MADNWLEQGIAAHKAGDKTRAKELFIAAIKDDPNSEQAWYYLAIVETDPRQRKAALERVLQINPDNTHARDVLAKVSLRIEDREQAAPKPPKSQPARIFEPGETPRRTGFKLPFYIPGVPETLTGRMLVNRGIERLQTALKVVQTLGAVEVFQREKVGATWWLFWLTVGTGAVVGAVLFALGALIAEFRLAAAFSPLYTANVFRPIVLLIFTLPATLFAVYAGCYASHWYATKQARGIASLLDHSQVLALAWLPGHLALGSFYVLASLLVGRPFFLFTVGGFLTGGLLAYLSLIVLAALVIGTVYLTGQAVRSLYKFSDPTMLWATAGIMVVVTGLIYSISINSFMR